MSLLNLILLEKLILHINFSVSFQAGLYTYMQKDVSNWFQSVRSFNWWSGWTELSDWGFS